MARSVGESLLEFGSELLVRTREMCNSKLDEAAFEERIIGIGNATAALYEADITDDKIISLLQKYWDLRRSEAEGFLQREKDNNYLEG